MAHLGETCKIEYKGQTEAYLWYVVQYTTRVDYQIQYFFVTQCIRYHSIGGFKEEWEFILCNSWEIPCKYCKIALMRMVKTVGKAELRSEIFHIMWFYDHVVLHCISPKLVDQTALSPSPLSIEQKDSQYTYCRVLLWCLLLYCNNVKMTSKILCNIPQFRKHDKCALCTVYMQPLQDLQV